MYSLSTRARPAALQALTQFRVQDQLLQPVGRGMGVFTRHDVARLAVDHDLGRAIGIGHHDRQGARAGFQDGDAEAVHAAQGHAHVQGAQGFGHLGVRDTSLEFHLVRDMGGLRACARRRWSWLPAP